MNQAAQFAAQTMVDCARENGYLDGPLSNIPALADEEKKLFIRMFGELKNHLQKTGSHTLSPDEISSLFTFTLAKAAELVAFYLGGKREEVSLLGMFDGKVPLYADEEVLGFCKECSWPKEAAEAFLAVPPENVPEDADPLLVLFESLKWAFRISEHLIIAFIEDTHAEKLNRE